MFSGAQISLYPMTDDFVAVILGAIAALDPYRPRFRIETDDLSTLIVGPPEELFPAMRDLFVAAAGRGVHCVLAATVSRGCPGEPDDPICTPAEPGHAPRRSTNASARRWRASPRRPRPARRSRRSSRSIRSARRTTWTRSMAASTS